MTNSISGLNLLFSGSNVEEIKTRLQYKLEEYCQQKNIVLDRKFYDVPSVCYFVFAEDLIPKSRSPLIYRCVSAYYLLFKNELGSDIRSFHLALNDVTHIKLNIPSISLLMLFYNQDFRNYCNVKEKTRTIVNKLKGVIELIEVNYDNNPF